MVIPYTKGMIELAKQPPDPDAPAATERVLTSLGLFGPLSQWRIR